jgi:uncharacterized RDD family membrane protein YckC
MISVSFETKEPMSAQDEVLQIETPENVAFGYEIAGIGSRFLAALVDTLLIVILETIVMVTALFAMQTTMGTGEFNSLTGWVIGAFILVAFALLWGYYIVFELLWNGQPPGKRLVKLRVICADGRPITLTESVIRNIARLVDLIPLSYGVGVIAMFLNDRAQRLGDLAAGTLVVFDQGELTLESLRDRGSSLRPLTRENPLPGEWAASSPLADLPLHLLTGQDIAMIEDYLRRRMELVNSQRVAEYLVEVMTRKMGMTSPPVGRDASARWLAELADGYHQRG